MRRERQIAPYDPYDHFNEVVEELQQAMVPSTEFKNTLALIARFIRDPEWKKFPQEIKSELEIDLVGVNGLIHLLASDVQTYHQKLRLTDENIKPTYSLADYQQLVGHIEDFVTTVRLTYQCGRYVPSLEREEMKRIHKKRLTRNS